MESTDNQKDMTRRATLKGDWTSLDKKVDCPSIQHKRKPRCCRESMIVDFSKISGEFLKILNLSLRPDWPECQVGYVVSNLRVCT